MREIVGGCIDWNLELWKYVRTSRFVEILDTGRIYFAAATQFTDPFEGAVAVQANPPERDPRYAEMESIERAFFELKRLTKISCWHQASYESDAMWNLYAGEHKGIAICTTPARMREAFRSFRLQPKFGTEEIWGGPIQYVDLTQVRLKGVGMIDRFFIKHRAFEWEREFRLAISLRGAEEFGVAVPEKGIFVEVDLATLMDRVVLGTSTSDEERQLVREAGRKHGFEDRIQTSTLLGQPRFI